MKSCYIHVPFCKTICSYCDFCKVFYDKKWTSKYLESLNLEIKNNYQGETLKTLYIGGGTPTSLDYDELEKLLIILKQIKLDKDYEYTIETNVESLDINKIKLLKKYGINRISIGVQSVVEKNISFLERHHTEDDVRNIIKMLKENEFNNINVDLIYALLNETLEDLKYDLNFFLSLDIPHISTYSLIIEEHTKLYNKGIKNIDEDLDLKMYNLICNTLKKNQYNHYEVSNFSKTGFESKHNLTYWNNLEYYGFGVGASGYINNARYDNTKSINKYLTGITKLIEEKLNFNIKVENEFILGLRKINGINKIEFKNKYNIDINNINIVNKLIEANKLIDDGKNIFISEKYLYTSNNILIEFLGGNYEQTRNI